MNIAFYKAAGGTWLDRLINACSGRLGYSHVELVFSDGTFFSSSPRDGGCRFKWIAQDFHWDLLDLDTTIAQETAIRVAAAKLADAPTSYDYRGVINFIWPSTDNPAKLFCSETCIDLLQQAGMLGTCPGNKVSPNTLSLIIRSVKGLIRL